MRLKIGERGKDQDHDDEDRKGRDQSTPSFP
jgi:hypothetical protein